MASTALSLIRAMTGELGLAQPTLVAGSQDNGVIQYLSLLNALGRELTSGFAWTALSTEYRFTTQYVATTGTTVQGSAVITGIPSTNGLDTTYMVTGTTGIAADAYVQSVDSATQVTLTQPVTTSGTSVALNFCKTKYTMPSDYDRVVDKTQWDKTRHWSMLGPETPQQWAWLKSGYISQGPRIRFRPMGGFMQLWPPLASAEYLGLEYISKNWVFSATGTGKSSVTVDTDTLIFPDNLIILGLKDKFTQAKGLARQYAEDYANELSIAQAADLGMSTLSMNSVQNPVLIGIENVPDSGYGR
jgi:hypothetical protein